MRQLVKSIASIWCAVILTSGGSAAPAEDEHAAFLDHLHVGSIELRVESTESDEASEGQAVRRVPGFDTRGFDGVVRKAGEVIATVGLGLEVVRSETPNSTTQVAVIVFNSIEDLVVITDIEPDCCSGDLPWSSDLTLPIELDIGESRTLLIADPGTYARVGEIRIELEMEDGGRRRWTVLARNDG